MTFALFLQMRDRDKKEVYCMDLEQQVQIVDKIHDRLSELVGKKLRIRANMGRSKIVESEGVLMEVHPQLFMLEVERKRGRKARQSYQYVDVLTGMVKLFLMDGSNVFEGIVEDDDEGDDDDASNPLASLFSDDEDEEK